MKDLEKEMFELEQELDIPSHLRWHNSKPKQETLEEVRNIERTELFNSIYSVVKKIPIKDVNEDAMDAPSCAYELEQLFYKWQAERMYSEEKIRLMLRELNDDIYDIYPLDSLEEWFENHKK